MEDHRRWRRWLPWIVAYVVFVAAVVLGVRKCREWTVTQLATPKSIADWQVWRKDVRRSQDQSPGVQRRVPKSSEPPALIMMRDHFVVSMLGAVLFSSALYWVLAWFVMGILGSKHGSNR